MNNVTNRVTCPVSFLGRRLLQTSGLMLLLLTCANSYAQSISITAHPRQWTVNEPGILEFEMALEEGELASGDHLSLFIPGSWVSHIFPVCRAREQRHTLADYLSVRTEGGASMSFDVRPRGRDGTYHRLAREVVMRVDSGAVHPGETIRLAYGNEGHPIRASFLAQESFFELRHRESEATDRESQLGVRVVTSPATTERLLVTAPTLVKTRDAVRVHVTGRDEYGNPAPLPLRMTYRSQAGSISGSLETQENTFHTFTVQFHEPGFHRVRVGTEGTDYTFSNPIKVTAEAPQRQIYWGDLHSHSHVSKDGVGRNPFVFARDHANLDFYAQTEHTSNDPDGVNGITDREWQQIQDDAKRFHVSDQFVTILGYETSFSERHHNVYFDTDTAPLYRQHEMGTVQELWNHLEVEHAFTVPHHTGITWGSGSEWITNHPAGMRPLIEIYSGHGLSELYDPDHQLSYNQVLFTRRWQDWLHAQAPETPDECRGAEAHEIKPGPYYAEDAWKLGLRFGTIASSDDHSARPGQPEKGLTAVRAERLDRSDIFRAFRQKQTYATTGQRIYLDVRVNGKRSGQVEGVDTEPRIEIEVHGTDSLAWVELVRFDAEQNQYDSSRWYPDGLLFTRTIQGEKTEHPVFYYVRLRQKSLVKDRPVMAWSSPIWVHPQ